MGRNRLVNVMGQATSLPFSTADISTPAANTAAVVTYAAFPGSVGTTPVGNQPMPAGYPVPASVSHAINGLIATVDSDTVLATPPFVQIEDGAGNVVFKAPLETGNIGAGATAGTTLRVLYKLDLRFPIAKRGTAGRAMIITVPAQGAARFSALNVLGHWTEVN